MCYWTITLASLLLYIISLLFSTLFNWQTATFYCRLFLYRLLMKSYSDKFKKTVVKKLLECKSSKYICSKYKLPKSTVYYWKELYGKLLKDGHKVITRGDYFKLKTENNHNKMLLEIYNRSSCSPQSPEANKLFAIDNLKSQYPIKTLCSVLCVDRNKYYRHLKERKTQNEVWEETLTPLIIKIFHKNNSRYGAKRICATLQQEGFQTSPRKVSEIMKKNDLKVVIGKNRRNNLLQHSIERIGNVGFLTEKYACKAPNTVWLSDIAEILCCGLKFYLCIIEDLFSRYVVSCGISTKANTELLISTFHDAFLHCGNVKPVIFHTDNGKIFKSKLFKAYLETQGLKQSFSRILTPTDNSSMESFICTLKKEELYRHRYKSPEDLFGSVSNYIKYYNNERIHSSLGYKTPKSLYNKKGTI